MLLDLNRKIENLVESDIATEKSLRAILSGKTRGLVRNGLLGYVLLFMILVR